MGSYISLDGEPVNGVLVAASATLGGYDRATVRIPEDDLVRVGPTQRSILSVFQGNGRILWEGRLSLLPAARRGVVQLEASGYRVGATKAHGRLLLQTRDLSIWSDPVTSPYGGTGSDVSFSTDGGVVKAVNPTAASQTLRMRAWFPGSFPTRVAASTSVTVLTGVGPSGALTSQGTGTDVSFATNITDDMVEVRATVDAQSTLTISDLRVNGSETQGDSFSTSDAIRVIGTALGWDVSGVPDLGMNVLPFDWLRGGWHEALDYLTELKDVAWRVLDDRGQGAFLEVADWSREWTTFWESGADDSGLLPLEVFDRVIVWWTDLAGAHHSVKADAAADLLTGSANAHEITLSDRQPDETLAKGVASTALAYLSTPRYRGSVTVAEATRSDGAAGGILDILPGDSLVIADWERSTSQALRIRDVSFGDGVGPVTLGIEKSEPLPRR